MGNCRYRDSQAHSGPRSKLKAPHAPPLPDTCHSAWTRSSASGMQPQPVLLEPRGPDPLTRFRFRRLTSQPPLSCARIDQVPRAGRATSRGGRAGAQAQDAWSWEWGRGESSAFGAHFRGSSDALGCGGRKKKESEWALGVRGDAHLHMFVLAQSPPKMPQAPSQGGGECFTAGRPL